MRSFREGGDALAGVAERHQRASVNLTSFSGRVARVDRNHDPRNVARLVAHQKCNGVGDIDYLRHSLQGAASGDFGLMAGVKRPCHLSIEKSRRYRIDGDAERADFARQRFGEADQRRLGGAVDRQARVAGKADDRGDVDDAAAPGAPSLIRNMMH